jgi:outer membrane protein TolC
MSWNRWTTRVLGGVLAVTALGGCKQQLFLDPGDYQEAVTAKLPKALETDPRGAMVPPLIERIGNGPATVLDPSRPARYMTLKECIAIALEQGNIGITQFGNFGNKSDLLGQNFQQVSVGSNTDAIRAFALDPASAGAGIEFSLAKFDTQWVTSMSWQKVDQPVAAQFLNFQQQRDVANFSSTLAKPLPTGGVAGITFSVDYSKFSQIPASQQNNFVNPNYTPRLSFGFEQPLLQGYGVELNQLLPQGPTPRSGLFPGFRPFPASGQQAPGTGGDGILINRIRFDQTLAAFDAQINSLLVNVETAYWNLYASYYNLYAQEEGLRQSFDGWRFTKARVDAGTDNPQQLNQARAQFELFRSNVYRARGQVLESERQLRGLMAVRSDDGFRIVPIDEPNVVPFQPDFYEAANEAIAHRPEVLLARQDVKVQSLSLHRARLQRRPDLRAFGSYDLAGLGTRLDGPEFIGPNGTLQGNALTSFSNNQFNSWTIGLQLHVPVGYRESNAVIRQTQLGLTRSYIQLRDTELKALEQVTRLYREVVGTYAVIPALRSRREELQIYVWKTREVIQVGRWTPQDFFNYLQVQRDLADAISNEFAAIAQYQSALAQFEFTKGTIQQYNNISVNEGPLPPNVAKRAADHIKERTKAALEVRLRQPPDAPPAGHDGVGPAVGTPFIGSIPPLVDTTRQAAPEQLPPPSPADKGDPKKDLPKPLPGPITGSPAGRPLPAMPGAIPTNPGTAPDAYFESTGTVSVERQPPLLRPGTLNIPPRGVGGPTAPPAGLSVPAGPTELPPLGGAPAIPAPPGSGGIPPTLPGNPGR